VKHVKPNNPKRMRRWLLLGVVGVLFACVLLAGVSALSNARLPTHSAVVDRLSVPDKAHLAEAQHLRRSVGDAVWPGWGGADIPAIVYNEEYAFLVGLAEPADGWVKVPANERRGDAWETVPGETFDGQPYVRQRLADGVTPENFCLMVGQRWAYGMQTQDWMKISVVEPIRQDLPALLRPFFPYRLFAGALLEGSDKYISLHAHEAFHAYQGITAPERLAQAEQASWRWEKEYPWADRALQGAWQVELNLLASALRAGSREETVALARQFLAQRDSRRQAAGLRVELVDYERQREWLEGLARYAELESWRQAATSGYQLLAETDVLPDFQRYSGWSERWSQEIKQITRMADDQGDGRFYYTGMAQAFLLDRLLPDWKHRALENGAVWLEGLLAEAVRTQ
jgi:hypothetical protein